MSHPLAVPADSRAIFSRATAHRGIWKVIVKAEKDEEEAMKKSPEAVQVEQAKRLQVAEGIEQQVLQSSLQHLLHLVLSMMHKALMKKSSK